MAVCDTYHKLFNISVITIFENLFVQRNKIKLVAALVSLQLY